MESKDNQFSIDIPKTNMVGQLGNCWRSTLPCPPSGNVDQSLQCKAWYRCETAGDYVIRWRCQSLEDGVTNATDSTFQLCDEPLVNASTSACPPPAVCAGDYNGQPMGNADDDTSTDFILVIAVAAFALVALFLIVVSTYKYWSLRKRLRHRLQTKYPGLREFPYPLRYHSLWGTGLYSYDYAKPQHSSKAYGNPYTDVYIARPYDASTTYPEQHLLTSSDESIDHRFGDFPSRPSPGRVTQSSDGKLRADPSIITGSFVFHPPLGNIDKNKSGLTEHHKDHPALFGKSRSPHHFKKNEYEKGRKGDYEKGRKGEYEKGRKSGAGYHFYKGKNSSQSAHHYVNRPSVHSTSYAYDPHLPGDGNNVDLSRIQHVSSIPIPCYDTTGFYSKSSVKTSSPYHGYGGQQSYPKDTSSHQSDTDSIEGSRTAHSSKGHISPYALGLLGHDKNHPLGGNKHFNIMTSESKSMKSPIYATTDKNKRQQKLQHQQQQLQHHYHSHHPVLHQEQKGFQHPQQPQYQRHLTSGSGNHHSNHYHQHQQQQYHQHHYSSISDHNNAVQNPDVINSHNFSSRYVQHYEKGVFRTSASAATPSAPERSHDATSCTESSINNNDTNKNNLEISYDSFRNEHLREVAKRGAASSSTLDAGFRNMIPAEVTSASHKF